MDKATRPPDGLHRLVLDAIAPYIDCQALTAVIAEERRQRRALTGYLDGWTDSSPQRPT